MTEIYRKMDLCLSGYHISYFEDTKEANQHIYSITAGLKASGRVALDEGVFLSPRAELFVLQNFGDTEVTNKVRGEGLTSTDTVHPEVIGETTYGAAATLRSDYNQAFFVFQLYQLPLALNNRAELKPGFLPTP